uniref:A-kinase anchor protein 5 isoform X3 n=1 Tax=Myodes glareolus TaxID=447135 RepID=UPI0020222F2D|nr:A-kinase anchor protein 5 isoform X3 [Myodes glareolus]
MEISPPPHSGVLWCRLEMPVKVLHAASYTRVAQAVLAMTSLTYLQLCAVTAGKCWSLNREVYPGKSFHSKGKLKEEIVSNKQGVCVLKSRRNSCGVKAGWTPRRNRAWCDIFVTKDFKKKREDAPQRMKESSVKMDSGASEIQIETKEEKEPGAVCPQKERQERNRATLCFKRRKKASKMKSKVASKTTEGTKTCPPEAGASDQPQPAGAWASIKRFVTPGKRSESSKKQKPSAAEVQPEDAALPKKKAKSRLKIPCIRFSRGAKRSRHSKLTEDADYNTGVQQRGTDDLETKPQTQPADRTSQAKSTQGPQEGVLVEDGKDVQEPQVSRNTTSGENVISVELELKDESSAIQMGTPVLEKEAEVIKEKPSVQAQQASSEVDSPHPVASHVPASPATAYQRGVDKPSDTVRDRAPSAKDDRSRKGAAEEKKASDIVQGQGEETPLSQAEEAAVSQAHKSAVGQAKEAVVAQAKEAVVAQAKEAVVAQAEEVVMAQAEEAVVALVEETVVAQTEEAVVAQVEEAVVAQAEEAAVAHAEEAAVAQIEEAVVAQAEEVVVAQAEEAAVTQTEEAVLAQAEEAAMTQVEEALVAQMEEALVAQTEETVVAQAEEAVVAQVEEAAVAQAEEAVVAQVEETVVAQADEATVAQAPDLKENGTDTEKPRSEECKRMEPIAIIITDTEISEFDVKKSKNVPKQFLISVENEQVGVFANDSDFEGRTSEQYETLLIETASSLVKNAIQLSVEQLVNEMVSEDNKINALLQ